MTIKPRDLERADLAAWRRRDRLRHGNTARPVRSARVYQRKAKHEQDRQRRDG